MKKVKKVNKVNKVACCVAAALALLTTAASAQESDGGTLRLYQAGMEIGRETFTEAGRSFSTTVIIPLLHARIVSTIERDNGGRALRLDERVFALPSDTLVRAYSAVRDGDSLRMSLTSGASSRRWAKMAQMVDFGPDQSLATFIRLVQRSGRRDTTYQVWLPNADTTFDFRIAFSGDTAHATIGPQIVLFSIGPDGRVRSADFPLSRVHYDRHFAGELPPLAGLTPPRADYSAPAGAAWTAEDVRVAVT